MSRFLAFFLLLAATFGAAAQYENIRFALLDLAGEEVPADAARAFDTRLRQALGRTAALIDNPEADFALRPTLIVDEAAATEGLVRDVNRLSGSLLLEVFNTCYGTIVYSQSIPLSASVTGSKDEAFKRLATNIRSADPVFVRFTRNARKHIAEYYEQNGLYSDCNPAPAEADTIPLTQPEPQPEVIPVPDVPVAVPEPSQAAPRIRLSHPEAFSFKVISCTGVRIGEKVTIVAEFVNKGMRYASNAFRLMKAIDTAGKAYPRDRLLINGFTSAGVDTPEGVKVRLNITLSGIKPDVDAFSYIFIDFDSYTIEIYDLPIKWINE